MPGVGFCIVIALLVFLVLLVLLGSVRAGARHRPRGDGYLVYPYLDLDDPGDRGSYYAMAECPAANRGHTGWGRPAGQAA